MLCRPDQDDTLNLSKLFLPRRVVTGVPTLTMATVTSRKSAADFSTVFDVLSEMDSRHDDYGLRVLAHLVRRRSYNQKTITTSPATNNPLSVPATITHDTRREACTVRLARFSMLFS